MIYSKEKIEKAIKAKGYKWFDGPKDYDLNIVGVRNSAPGKKVTNIFDDTITVTFKIGDEWIYKEWACTTDPGKKAMEHFDLNRSVKCFSLLGFQIDIFCQII